MTEDEIINTIEDEIRAKAKTPERTFPRCCGTFSIWLDAKIVNFSP